MKIVVVAPESFPVPPVRGGAIQVGIEQDVRWLDTEDFVVLGVADPLLPLTERRGHVTYLRYQADPLSRLMTSTYRLPFRSQHSRSFARPYVDWCARQVRRLQPDVIHVHSRPQFIPALKRAGPSAAIVLHISQLSALTLSRVWDAELCGQIDAIVGNSRFIVEQIQRLHPSLTARAIVRYSGVDTERIRPWWELPAVRMQARASFEIKQDEIVVAYLGRLVENKGAHLALEAFARLASRTHRMVRLLVIGSEAFGQTVRTSYLERLEALAAPCRDRVSFTGYVPTHRVPELLLAADVLMVPSLVEDALPRAMLEAMASGLPVIGHVRGGIPEMIEDGVTGCLVREAGDVERLTGALHRLVENDSLRATLGRSAREMVVRRCNPAVRSAGLRELYATTVNQQRPYRPATVLYCETGTGYGGSGRSLQQLLKGLDRSKFRPIVVVTRGSGVTDAIRALGIPVLVWPSPQIESTGYMALAAHVWRHELRRTIRLLRLIRRERVELLHLNNDVYSNMAGLLAGWLAKVPVVCHLRLTRAPTRIERWLGRLATTKIVLTEEAVAFYRGFWPEGQLACIPNGTEIPAEPLPDGSRLREAMGIPEKHRVVSFVARCIPHKGYEEFLQAAKIVRERVPAITFTIFGNGPGSDEAYERRMRNLAGQLGLNGELIWGGWQGDSTAIYGLPDVIVQASTTFPEGLSRVVLEAMAFGKPVVATRIVGNREAVVDGETGLLVEPGDARALAQAIMTVLRDPNFARQLGEHGRRRVAERFSLPHHAERIMWVYENALRKTE